jgi:dipeptidyl-peptidase 4
VTEAERQAALQRALAGELAYPGVQVQTVLWTDARSVVLQVRDAGGMAWLRYDIETGGLTHLFDAAAVERSVEVASHDSGLPAFCIGEVSSLAVTSSDAICFDWSGKAWRCVAADGAVHCQCVGNATGNVRPWPAGVDVSGDMGPVEVVSPDGRFAAVRFGPNVHIRSQLSGSTVVATLDGQLHCDYGNTLATSWSGRAQMQLAGMDSPVDGLWSADSRYFLTFLADSRHTTELPLLRSQPPGGRRLAPDVVWYKSQLSTDAKLVQLRYVLLDTDVGAVIPVQMPWIDAPVDPVRTRFVRWRRESPGFFFLSHSRGARRISLWQVADPTALAEVVRTEQSDTRAGVTTAQVQWGVEDLPGTQDYLWASDVGGRMSLYLLCGADGRLTHRISQEDVTFAQIRHVDRSTGRVMYMGYPDVSAADPARMQLFSAALDGTSPIQHTSLDEHHRVHLSPDGLRFIDVASRVDRLPTVSVVPCGGGDSKVLFVSDGADWAIPTEARPRRFTALAADGQTPLYGTMYRPSYWSPQGRYPLIDWVSGSAELMYAPEGFDTHDSYLQLFAESGFIVVRLDARGTPGRTKAFNDRGIGVGHNQCAMDDHIAALRALAQEDETINDSAVGVGGWSAGGHCAWRFAARGGAFFKAAVIGAPSCDPHLLGPTYVEYFLGVAEHSELLYREGADDPFTENVQAALLLIHGELDDDVHPANTLRLADQLMNSGKLFEMLIVPGHSHEVQNDFVIRSIADFFVRRLG